MNSLFTSARLKLTAVYTLIIFVISGAISGLFYLKTSQILAIEYERLEQRLQLEIRGFTVPGSSISVRRIRPEDLERTRNQIVTQLLQINGLIIVVVAVAGYILSGITLAPIAESMEEQRRFVGDAAHELKTPITALKTSLEVNLMDDSLGSNARSILLENLEDVVSLEELTSSLLKLSRFDDVQLTRSMVDLGAGIEKSVKRIQSLAKKKHIVVEIQGLSKPVFVKADPIALADLWIIFLDNAIKYSPEGSEISVLVAKQRQSIKVQVVDQGIGIAKKDLPHIFDRFFQADSARSNNGTRGYGLGLAVAQKIVKLHGGSIGVKSVLGKGTTFTVTLPVV